MKNYLLHLVIEGLALLADLIQLTEFLQPILY